MQTLVSGPWWPIVVPLLGAVVLLATGPRLPWLARRMIALVAIGSVLVSMPEPGSARVALPWSPLNLFRLGLEFEPDPLLPPLLISLGVYLLALTLSPRLPVGLAAGGLVGLAATAGMVQATNLLTLAVASSLLDLSLALQAIRSPAGVDRASGQALIPSVASTLLLVLAALQMDVDVGSASLSRELMSPAVLNLLLAAGVLRLFPFPIQPRASDEPRAWLVAMLSITAGVGLLVRLEGIAPGWGERPALAWVAWLTLVAGALLAATGPDTRRLAGFWLAGSGGLLWVTAGRGGAVPILLPALSWALAMLSIWLAPPPPEGARPWRRLGEVLEPTLAQVPWPPAVRRVARQLRARRWRVALSLWALASLVGMPLTAGFPARLAQIRWTVATGQLGLVLLDVACAGLLAAGAFALVPQAIRAARAGSEAGTGAALAVLSGGLLWLGMAPSALQIQTSASPGVHWLSGTALVIIPWLLGMGVYVLGRRGAQRWRPLRQLIWGVLRLDWLRILLNWVGRQAAAAGWWLGNILEGGGALGWALFLLALAGILFLVQ